MLGLPESQVKLLPFLEQKDLLLTLSEKQDVSNKVFLTHSYLITIRKENQSLTRD